MLNFKRVVSLFIAVVIVISVTIQLMALDRLESDGVDDLKLVTITYELNPMYRFNAPRHLLNQGGESFEIIAHANGNSYASFCAHAGSNAFSNYGYMEVKHPEYDNKYDAIVSALNFIYDEYGSLDVLAIKTGPKDGYARGQVFLCEDEISTRVLTQIMLWHLLDDIDIELMISGISSLANGWPLLNDSWETLSYYPFFSPSKFYVDAIIDVLAAVNTEYKGEGDVAGFVYLLCARPGCEDIISCQPQLIPVYNKDKKEPEPTPTPSPTPIPTPTLSPETTPEQTPIPTPTFEDDYYYMPASTLRPALIPMPPTPRPTPTPDEPVIIPTPSPTSFPEPVEPIVEPEEDEEEIILVSGDGTPPSKMPQTGEDDNILFWAIGILCSLIAVIYLISLFYCQCESEKVK